MFPVLNKILYRHLLLLDQQNTEKPAKSQYFVIAEFKNCFITYLKTVTEFSNVIAIKIR